MDTVARASSGSANDAPASAHASWPKPRTAYYTLFVLILSTTFAHLDIAIVPYLASSIKEGLNLSDTQLSLLLGVSFGLFYTLVGVPIAWFIDRYSRKWILAIGIATWSLGTALCGAAQNFQQLFVSRFLVGAGEAVNGPACYSIVADLFPREKIPRAVAIMQIGSVLGPAIALAISAWLLHRFLSMPPIEVPFGTIAGWQLVFIIVGLPGVLVAVLMITTMQEPVRHVIPNQITGSGLAPPPKDFISGILAWFKDFGVAFRYMGTHWNVYVPFFGSLFLHSLGMGFIQWMPIFFQRTFGWSPAQHAAWSSVTHLILVPLGMITAVMLSEYYARARRDDAAIRTFVIGRLIAIPGIFSVLMPNPWVAFALSQITYFAIGLAAPSQNAAMQIITPAELRGKITALYLFIYSVVGLAFSPVITALITDFILRDESQIRWAIFVPGVIFPPLSLLVIWLGMKPYGREVARLKALEA